MQNEENGQTFSVNVWEDFFFYCWSWGIFFCFISFILLYFLIGCSSLKKLLQVKLAMIASAVHSLLYRTEYDSGACWCCSQFEKTHSEYFVHGCWSYLCSSMLIYNVQCCLLRYDIQDGHYTKAQRLSMTISVAMKGEKKEIIVLVLGIVRGKIAL